VRRLAANVVFGFEIMVFAFMCIAGSPIILCKFGVDWLQDRIEARWPNSYRAQAFSFWLGLLAPVVVSIILVVGILFVVIWLRGRRSGSVA
jgi:uncharacterized metal-binding protein